MSMGPLCWFLTNLWTIAAQGEGDFAKTWLGCYYLFWIVNVVAYDVGLVLWYTSVCDMVFGGDDEAGWRHCINITFWTLLSATLLLVAACMIGPFVGVDPIMLKEAHNISFWLRYLRFVFSNAFVIIAHRKMHVVSLHLSPPISLMVMQVLFFFSTCPRFKTFHK